MRRLPVSEIVANATALLIKGVTVDLTRLDVSEPLDLSGAVLGNVDFSGSRFAAPVILRQATFQGLAWFKGCRFDAAFDASRAQFSNDLRMRGAVLAGPAVLSRAELHGVLDLDGVRFEDRADLDRMICFGNASMAATQFLAPVTLQGCELMGGLWCEGAVFASRVDFREVEVHGRTWLRNLRVTGNGGHAASGHTGSRDAARDIRSYGYRWV